MPEDNRLKNALEIIEKAPKEIRPILTATVITLKSMGEVEAQRAISTMLFATKTAYESMSEEDLVAVAPAELLAEWNEANTHQAENIEETKKLALVVLLALIKVMLTML